jgi:uncharacterized DUF497 family protein
MKFDFNREKNEKIFLERGITFDDVIEAIAYKGILLNFDNPNKGKYPNQKILVVNMNNYAYCVPYVIQKGDTWFLKTIYPSRKFKTLIGGQPSEKV